MKLREIIDKLHATAVNASDLDKEIEGGYAGDFLSFVMGKAPENCAWFTVMSNVNVAGVATLAGTGVVVLCEGAKADENLSARVKRENIDLIETDYDIYTAVLKYNNAD